MKTQYRVTHEQNSGTPAIPRHIGIIMDGNGRWAEKRHLPRLSGHEAGTKNINRVITEFITLEIPYMTLYAFSTENWNRPSQEVDGLMNILGNVIYSETSALHDKGVRLLHLGSLEGLSTDLQQSINKAVDLTKNNRRMTLSIAFNYGGKAEIVSAIKRIVTARIAPEKITESMFGQYLRTLDVPDPDLIIRTGGEMRLSNFLLWQSAYSEFYSTTTLWPDFSHRELSRALASYSKRNRRFGQIKKIV